LNRIFYIEKNYDGINALYIKAKARNNKITIKDVKEWLQKQAVKQQTHIEVKKKEFLPIYSEVPNSYQIDLTFFPKYKKQNKGFYILFTAININTRYVYAYYSKNRTNENLLDFLKKFENEVDINFISGDLEFKRKDLTDFLIEKDIQYDFYKADSHKLGIINRFHRTLKAKVDSYFIANDTVKWIDVMDSIIKNYNNTFHTGINIEPAKVNALIESEIVNSKRGQTADVKKDDIIYKIGDKIRVKNTKEFFDKNKASYSSEVYIIIKVNSNSVRAIDKDDKQYNFKKPNLLKVDKIENVTTNTSIKKAIKENKIERLIKKEDLISDLQPTRLRVNPKKKIL
jgi:hypothetical protein